VSKQKRILAIFGISLLLSLALILNIFLQLDYFKEIGFVLFLALISISLLDISKIVSETMFFKIKKIVPKIILSFFSLLLISISAYTTFSVRQWHSVKSMAIVDTGNKKLTNTNTRLVDRKKRLESQLTSLQSQISTKQAMIKSLPAFGRYGRSNKWLKHRYNKEIGKLNNQKTLLLTKIDDVDAKITPVTQQKLSLQQAISSSIGISGLLLETITNLTIAFTVEGIILFLCYSLSYVLKMGQSVDRKGAEEADIENRNRTFFTKEDIGEDIIDLKSIRGDLGLTQADFAKKMGVTDRTIRRVEKGENKVSGRILKELNGLNML